MGENERYDVGQIEGSEEMSKEEWEYFSKFWTSMGDQEEIIADKYGIDSETMKAQFAYIMNNLIHNIGEYIVDGAPLKCSMQADAGNIQKFTYKGREIISKPAMTEEMSVLQLPKNRTENACGQTFANIEDTAGGLMDEILVTLMEDKGKKKEINITSFGNCKWIEKDNITKIEEVVENIFRVLKGIYYKGRPHFTREEIAEIVIEMLEQGKGTCYCYMVLNNKWENLPTGYDFAEESYHYELPCIGFDGNTYMQFNDKEGINLMSMLFCRHGGIICAKESGQEQSQTEEMEDGIGIELYTQKDFYYLVDVVSGEANTYDGMVAVAYEVLNRCRINGKTIEEVVTSGAYTGYSAEQFGIVPEDGIAKNAVLAVLTGEVDNPIGDIQYHFGKQEGFDLWCEADKCSNVIVIGEGPYRNVFYEPYGAVHNEKEQLTEDAVIIYDNTNKKWLFDGEVIGNANIQ